LPKVANDKQAKILCGMPRGIINKVAVTPSNVTDARGMVQVLQNGGATYANNAYCVAPDKLGTTRKGIHLCSIKKNNMKDKNFDLDRYYTFIRSPFERLFSHDNKRLCYVGIAKNQFAEFINAICFNLRSLTVLAG